MKFHAHAGRTPVAADGAYAPPLNLGVRRQNRAHLYKQERDENVRRTR